MYKALSSLYLAIILGLPPVVAAIPMLLVSSRFEVLIAAASIPILYTLAFMFVCAFLSVPYRKAIVAGNFERRLDNPEYRRRRMHHLCWTCFFYSGPIYWLCLALPALRRIVFRLFGYRGHLDFTVYPDTWIRDLPLLDFGRNAYVANKATIGTNMALLDGTLVVGRIKLEEDSVVGHLAMLAPGVTVGKGAEVGVGCGIGLGTRIGDRVHVGPMCFLGHNVEVGANAYIGQMVYIGNNVVIRPSVKVHAGSRVPSNEIIASNEDALQFAPSRMSSAKPPAASLVAD